MDKKFTVCLYKELVKVTYNDAQHLATGLFSKYHVKKFKYTDDSIVSRYIIRWFVKRFIKKRLPDIIKEEIEFFDFSTLHYENTFDKF